MCAQWDWKRDKTPGDDCVSYHRMALLPVNVNKYSYLCQIITSTNQKKTTQKSERSPIVIPLLESVNKYIVPIWWVYFFSWMKNKAFKNNRGNIKGKLLSWAQTVTSMSILGCFAGEEFQQETHGKFWKGIWLVAKSWDQLTPTSFRSRAWSLFTFRSVLVTGSTEAQLTYSLAVLLCFTALLSAPNLSVTHQQTGWDCW